MIIITIMIAYIIGIIWGLYIKNIALFICLFFIFIILSYVIKNDKNLEPKKYFNFKISRKKILLILIIFLVSYLRIIDLENSFNNKLYIKDGDEIYIKAIVVSDKKEKEYKRVYTIKIESINNDKKYSGIRLKLSIKNKREEIKYGDRIYFVGNFEKPQEARNYGGFNYKEYLKINNVYGLVTTNKIEKIENGKYSKIMLFIHSIGNLIYKNANKILNKDEAGLLTSILIGNKNSLSDNIQEDFRDSSLSHILAVSGAHTSYIILAITVLLTKINIDKRLGKIITIVLLVFFMILTNLTSSVTRACIMAIYMIFGSLIYRKVNILTSISISLLIILIINPYRILDIGLQLSYGGTIGIVLLNNKFKITSKNKIKKSIISMLIVCISANLFIFPIIAYHYNTFSLTFFISNILAGPLLGAIIILGFITIFISFISIKLSKLVAFFLSKILRLLILIARFSSNLPFSKIYVTTPSIAFIVMYYLFLILTIKGKINFKILKNKKLISSLIIIVLGFQIFNILPQDLKIYFIDVGQGDSTLIITPYKKVILIDGGGSESYDVGKNTLLPYLLDRKIKKVDYIICSHFDTDHIGGILTIMEKMRVEKVVISKQLENSQNYQRFKQIVNKKKIKVVTVEKNDRLTIEKNLYFDILWPNNQNAITENVLNNNSIVCRLNYKSFSMLFTGDIEEIAERQILEEYKDNLELLDVTALKVGHHGSKTSSTQSFIEAVKPEIAVIGVGKNNKFGHPSFDVIERLENMNTKIYRTDKMGEITIKVNRKGKIKIEKLLE